ncbi:MAG TPA: efflux RND transporter periplasmic adaptor subunit [Clostridia bacterium]|nr:efflux RND transporter periplasmic adaptor subunit [Clostridia bacterium]
MKQIHFGQFGTMGLGLALSLGLGLLCGCKDGSGAAAEHGHEHGHDGEVKTAQITVFGERHEIFAEHRMVVAGTPTKFVTHVSDLKTFEPRREGPVRFQLRLGQEPPVERLEKAPARAGIYEAMLTFPKPGEWNVALVVPTEEGDKTIAFPPIQVFANAHDAEHAEVPEPPAGISFLKEQQWKILAGTEPASKHRLVEQLRLPAMVTARPGSLAQVTPPIAGRLLLPTGKSMPLVGAKVEAGQVLALIQPSFSEMGARFVESEGEVVRARLEFEQAELAFKRVEKLAKAEAKSGRELQEAEFALKTARAKYDAALALQATYRQVTSNADGQNSMTNQPAIELRSPIAGILVNQSGAAIGEYIPGDKALFTVLDPTTVFLEARIPETSVKRLGTAKSASYELPGETGRFVPITSEGQGRLVFLGIQVDASTRTVPLVYEVKNPDNLLRVGQSLNLFVETAHAEDALAIPSAAIVEEDGRPIAFVQVSGETFQKRDLTLGIRQDNWVQVVSGITEGERVVTKGAYAVRLASVSSAIPAHGHVH